MYVSYETFLENTLGAVPMQPTTDAEPQKQSITEEEYVKLAPMADLIIDHWTLDRVGRAVRNGEDLPAPVVTLYVALIDRIPTIMDATTPESGGTIKTFSNGIDTFTFNVTSNVLEQLRGSLGWLLDLLPVEWLSACVSFEGGNRYAG